MPFPIKYDQPPTETKPSKMSVFGFLGEWEMLLQRKRRERVKSELLEQPKGNNEIVLLIPGYQSAENTMKALRDYLKQLGYDARYWGLGRHNGNMDYYANQFGKIVVDLVKGTKKKVTVIGWSMGGIIARETVRKYPDCFNQIITYGTPIIGGPTYTIGNFTFSKKQRERISRLDEAGANLPIQVPLSIIFSKNDYIVSWPACIDSVNPNTSHYEVGSTHFGLGLDPDVWMLTAKIISRK